MKNFKNFKETVTYYRIKNVAFILILLFSVTLTGLTLKNLLNQFGSIAMSNENIVDHYGQLTSNTKIVIEDSLKTTMKENGVRFYFAVVHEKVNSTYTNKFCLTETDGVLIYYNEESGILNAVSRLKELDGKTFGQPINNMQELAETFDKYVSSISMNIPAKTRFFYESQEEKDLITFFSLFSFIIALCFTVVSFFICIEKIMKNYKIIKEKKVKKSAEVIE